MKKTISINIGGIIFHIEEDGYEKLRNYLNSIQRYFSSFADSKEIVSDIEGRIAERFISKQKTENKQVISLVDVEELIAAMGTVADFEAIEQAEDLITDPLQTAPATQPFTAPREEPKTFRTEAPPKTEAPKYNAPRKLYRDLRRKLLGGVAAGLAYHFSVDPLWVRLAFLVAVFGLPAGSGMMGLNLEGELSSISGFMLLVYIAMWVAFPGSATLEEDTKIKKFYRDPDRKVVGGVAAGVASYFGVDLGVVRFAWVLSILLFGTGLIVYIVLWIIAPVANTLTEKMEMQGEPITLSNIESNIKQGLNLEDKGGEEHAVTKLLLLPFRAIALVISALGKLLKGLGPILRILTGVVLVATSVIGLLSLLIAAGVALGLTNAGGSFDELPAPMLIFQELPGALVLSGALVAAVPLTTFLLLGLTLLSNKKLVGGTVWLTLLGLWIVGVIGTTIGGVSYQRNFAKRGEIVRTSYYAAPDQTLTFAFDETYDEENVDLDIRLAGYAGSDSIKLEKTMRARGRTREDAEHNAEMLDYNIKVEDSVFHFTEGPVLAGRGPFRDQRIDVVVNVPYGKQFNMTRDFYFSLSHWDGTFRNMSRYNMDESDVPWENLLWEVTRDSGLVCRNLPVKFLRSEEESNEVEYSFENDYESDLDLGERGTYIKQFPVENFNKIDIGGAYSIVVRQGAELSVSADAQEQEDIDDIKVYVENNTLRVKRNAEFNLFKGDWKRVGLIITMPTIEAVSLSGANKTLVTDFKGLNSLNVDISGASKSEINVETTKLDVSVSGASKATLRGSAQTANIDAHGACKVNANEMNIQTADVEASGASKIDLGRIPNLERHASGASKISVQE